ncbi:sigma 54-interacting transcriptional regulator [Clostridium sp. YIM B02515]|uniref:Sigma 54-interacting transcriptional regulator n=1 Tax=Clostridium rhizosphaerae TaxID=2803861 RepID=A0ABS1T8Z0_9CLOT|nr:sigma 54-interacting transcriptional regulator [Clostridium rhizosphaerae]MBL4935806.1 sigma 54-interacting transcriptional regulator [Clostridium rhizosphaerae]
MTNWGKAKYCFDDIIGVSDNLRSCINKAQKASQTLSPVLIFGETGTGKELFVQSIHNSSSRSNNPFIVQNCAAIPLGLLESILFGTIKGSFTGAEDKKGLFELAHTGTLYLDELNSMPFELQGKILRVLQEKVVSRVGDSFDKKVDVKVIVSLNEYPEHLLEKGLLRKDLYYRLNVVRIDVPPLRDRKEDIPHLIKCFINKFNKNFCANINNIEDEALETLVFSNWDGNIRELEHVIEGIFNFKKQGDITIHDLRNSGFKNINKIKSLNDRMDEFERSCIIEALAAGKSNVSKAAELLEIPRQTLQSKMKRLNIKQ